MTVGEIIKQVRWCIDEEATSVAEFNTSDTDNVFMDNIIRNKIVDALRWCALYSANILKNTSSSESSSTAITGILKNYVLESGDVKQDGTSYSYDETSDTYGVVTLTMKAIRVIRVRVADWNKSIRTKSLIAEDSDEYLALSDSTDTSSATNERPVAALIESSPLRVEVYPGGSKVEITVAVEPEEISSTNLSSDTYDVDVPSSLSSALCYYLAFLVLSAYNDTTKAKVMLQIAQMSIGGTSSE